MKRILVPIGCRSDEGLSAPAIRRLREHFDVEVLHLAPQQFHASYGLTECCIQHGEPDLILITGDRVEMCAAAAAAFHNKVPIAHFYAGIINDPICTYDDVDRHCITLWSDIQFCEDRCSAIRVNMLKSACELPQKNAPYVVGISHLDDLEVDESKVPGEPYDLVLFNRAPFESKQVGISLGMELDPTHMIIQIGGNPDGEKGALFCHGKYYGNLPRPQFLGLLKNCQRFITNSSAAIYEAPHFLKPEQIVMVGDRNKNRLRGPFQTGASDKIVEILKEYLK